MVRKARLMSSFCTRVTTIVPSVTTKKKITPLEPHCPGESQAARVSSRVATMPKAEGLNTCFPLMRNIYLEATVQNAANKLMVQLPVFSSRQRLAAEMSTLNPQDLNP